MRVAEELRFLILSVQREGNRLLAAGLRPLGLTPSQAEVLRVLGERQPLTLRALGELLVCETGANPSRLVDRLVDRSLVERRPAVDDRRSVTLRLTPEGRLLTRRIAGVEEQLYRSMDDLVAGQAVPETLATLRAMAAPFPSGQALQRRRTPPA